VGAELAVVNHGFGSENTLHRRDLLAVNPVDPCRCDGAAGARVRPAAGLRLKSSALPAMGVPEDHYRGPARRWEPGPGMLVELV
jgi:hypothetical protein